ncbi:MAG: T9SS type A sorting domain-containing protein [Candidatus Eisenbacteria bacterium]|nr:T9SS type A sorting domain-containing protein [Candidatus Eisenbacteria bacterium]
MDIPATCTNAGGSCGSPGGCVMEYMWTVPEGIQSNSVKVRVRMDNNGVDYYDVSNEPFTISDAAAAPDLERQRGFSLQPSYPNPSSPASTISYVLHRAAYPVRLSIHDTQGRVQKILTNGFKPAGRHTIRFDGNDAAARPLPSGVYYYTLKVGNQRVSRKLVLSR